MVKASMSCIKYTLFACNFIFLAGGIVLTVFGGIAVHKQYLSSFSALNYNTSASMLGLGFFTVLISFLGCYGALRENRCMLITFSVILTILFVGQMAVSITAFAYRQSDSMQKFLRDTMNGTIRDNRDEIRKVWDKMQEKWSCCGVDGPMDYLYDKVNISQSCCNKTIVVCNEETAFQKGCYGDFFDFFQENLTIIGNTTIGVALVELIGLIFACCLASAIRKERRR